MTTTGYQGIALLAIFAAMLLLSWGSVQDLPALAATGGALFALGAGALTVLRFAPPGGEEEES